MLAFRCAVISSIVGIVSLMHIPQEWGNSWMNSFHPLPGNGRYPELTSRLFQGDILLPYEGIEAGTRNAITLNKYKWPYGRVPYKIHRSFTQEERNNVTLAMRKIEAKTCVKFEPRVDETHWIYIHKEKNKGCYAMIGYRPDKNGSLPVNLQSPDCLRHTGTIQHELLHVLGLMHEQARPDRDEYVNILWENIDKSFHSDFSKARTSEVTTYGLPYDYKSVMHYPRFAFSKNGKDTIVAKTDPEMEIGQRLGATDGDLEKIRRMYNCTDV